jgi:hypothetical protein
MRGGRGQPELREVSRLHHHLALAASLPAIADGLDLDAELACCFEQVRSGRHISLPARRLKNDALHVGRF